MRELSIAVILSSWFVMLGMVAMREAPTERELCIMEHGEWSWGKCRFECEDLTE